MYNIKDNIVALATTPGQSALNVVRCSGSGCLELYNILTKGSARPKPNHAHLKTLYYKEKIIIPKKNVNINEIDNGLHLESIKEIPKSIWKKLEN